MYQRIHVKLEAFIKVHQDSRSVSFPVKLNETSVNVENSHNNTDNQQINYR